MSLFCVHVVVPAPPHDDEYRVELCTVLAASGPEAIEAARAECAFMKPICAKFEDLGDRRVVRRGQITRSKAVVGGYLADPAWTKFSDISLP
jgi:hypothetical protein